MPTRTATSAPTRSGTRRGRWAACTRRTSRRSGSATSRRSKGSPPEPRPAVGHGRATERSAGKDTTTGHWEMMGIRLDEPFPLYPDGFPPEIVGPFEEAIGRRILGNVPASGTEIIAELGEEHLRTGEPIVYTSGDSVFQIATHKDVVPLPTLYEWSRVARRLLTGEHTVGRVIARPVRGPAGSVRPFARASGLRRAASGPDGARPPPSGRRAGVRGRQDPRHLLRPGDHARAGTRIRTITGSS